MITENIEQTIPPDKRLARFILFSDWIRQDNTVKPDAFMPHPKHLDVSVTQHRNLTDQQIWERGKAIATQTKKTLHGRADLAASSVQAASLKLRDDPTDNNPNHALIYGWPADKAAQKSIAQQLAAASIFRKKYGAIA